MQLKKFFQGLPSDLRLLRTKALDRLGGNHASNYKYVFHMQVEDFFGVMAGLVGGMAVATGGLVFGLCALGVAGVIAACRYPSPVKRRAEVIADINEAGQELTGQRQDLYRLDLAQRQLHALTGPFNRAAALPEVVAEKAKALIEKTAPERGRVRVQGDAPYAFVRSVTRLERF
ncbi:MAG: hypothetical protein EPN97_08120 [Alphaproteobacteria bacterium]|nr:MAG: hypothetical protein EPN97_08120 [Alphaproteobacteria bacterium]